MQNQAWDADTAFEFAKAAAPYNVEWFEEPVHAFDMEALRSLRDQMDNAGISMEIAMGESVRSYHAHVDYAEHGVDHLQPALYTALLKSCVYGIMPTNITAVFLLAAFHL